MKFYNKILLAIGIISIIFQIANIRNFETMIDIICLFGSVFLIMLVFCFNKENCINWHIKNYKKFYFCSIMNSIICSIRFSGFEDLIRVSIYIVAAICSGYFIKYKVVE